MFTIKFECINITLKNGKVWHKLMTYDFGYSLQIVLGSSQSSHYTIDKNQGLITYDAKFAKVKLNENGYFNLFLD